MAAVGAGLYQIAMHVSFARPKRGSDHAQVTLEPPRADNADANR
jgi:hypothetical protein